MILNKLNTHNKGQIPQLFSPKRTSNTRHTAEVSQKNNSKQLNRIGVEGRRGANKLKTVQGEGYG